MYQIEFSILFFVFCCYYCLCPFLTNRTIITTYTSYTSSSQPSSHIIITHNHVVCVCVCMYNITKSVYPVNKTQFTERKMKIYKSNFKCLCFVYRNLCDVGVTSSLYRIVFFFFFLLFLDLDLSYSYHSSRYYNWI